MAQNRRLSQSLVAPPEFVVNFKATAPSSDAEAWLEHWKTVYARDIIDSRVVVVDAQISVEDACEILLSEDISCLAIKSGEHSFSDVNAFLTLAATKHTFSPEEVQEKPHVDDIFTAAKAGHVPVSIVSNLSEKNPLQTLPYDATVVSLLEIFARGTHRVLIHSSLSGGNQEDFVGIVSDRRLLSWFLAFAQQSESESLRLFLSNPLGSFSDSLSSLNLYTSVVATLSSGFVLEAMKLMSEEGVSSIAVLEEEGGTLFSAVSVTDIGKIVVPSQSNHILSMPLKQFISLIKGPDGSTDGEDRYPVYSVLPTSTMMYTIQKLLATNAHRVFVTQESSGSSPILSPMSSGNLTGLVSIVDILSVFARLANVQDVDPTRMQRHRRASSVSSQASSKSDHSRSSSRTSVRRALSVKNSQTAGVGVGPGQKRDSSTATMPNSAGSTGSFGDTRSSQVSLQYEPSARYIVRQDQVDHWVIVEIPVYSCT
ncbi:hypothetical protein BT96DRAFT_808931 [Gymnopus androsaceus JB14]|uniref:CBS domain-containing protein n=1 Tax=Gymnopus androsaceus JB14 TaxID=1447944 RepID=A0A6A4I7N3_9AGAR|nr:hypothetical protein BT96DRAFT_808931 [Gymnopus androsaceus JB14]